MRSTFHLFIAVLFNTKIIIITYDVSVHGNTMVFYYTFLIINED